MAHSSRSPVTRDPTPVTRHPTPVTRHPSPVVGPILMNDPIITVEGLSKRYIIGHQANGHSNLREVLTHSLTAPLRKLRGITRSTSAVEPLPAARNREEFWALKDLNFDVARGEVVGIVGRN